VYATIKIRILTDSPGKHQIVYVPRLFIEYTRSYLPNLEAVSCIRNLNTSYAAEERKGQLHEAKGFGSVTKKSMLR